MNEGEPIVCHEDGGIYLKLNLLYYRQLIVGKNRMGIICDRAFRTIDIFSLCAGCHYDNCIRLRYFDCDDAITTYLRFQFNMHEFELFLSKAVHNCQRIVLCPILRPKPCVRSVLPAC